MPPRRSHFVATLALLAPGFFASAQGAGLGEAVLRSQLGQALQVEITLVGDDAPQLGSECFRLAPPASANDELPWLREAQMEVRSGNPAKLVVRTRSAVHTPVLMLGLVVGCEAQLRREYPLLLTPASMASEPGAAATPPAKAAEDEIWRTVAGDSAHALAQALYPGQPRAAERYARAIVANNPEIFASFAAPLRSPLAAGLALRMPPSTAAAKPSAPPARVSSSATAASPALRRTPTSAPRKAAPIQAAADQAAPPPPLAAADRLMIAGEALSLRQSYELGASGASPATPDAKQRQRLRDEQQLLLAIDDRIATQIELDDRIIKLENAQKRLQAENQRLSTLVAEQQTALAQTLPLPWRLPASLWLAPAGVLGVLLMLFALWWRHRRALTAPMTPLQAEMEALPGVSNESEFETEALSSADIWPDAGTASLRNTKPAMHPGDWGPPTMAPANVGPSSLMHIDDDVEEHDSAVELAEIMMSFGRVQGAAETLAEFVRANPKQAVKPWVKLLEVYHVAGMRGEFDALAQRLNKTFNVKAVSWEDFNEVKHASETVEQIAHVTNMLISLWATRDCQVYLNRLLRDNRKGTRQGFPLGIIDDLLMLNGVLEITVGAFRPTPEEMAEAEAEPVTAAPLALVATEAKPATARSVEAPATAEADFVLDLDEGALTPSPAAPPSKPGAAAQLITTMVEFNLDEDLQHLDKKSIKH